ncbi:metal ABC transporter permease [Jannaschia marina]|uniref:metal ABC transporter permease n=1 Tax=Jannaschia marina TaxID=2741674 RepID=UPI0015C76B42|nr:metal ABC transporter permease [Jannaschia marina]
MFFDGFLLRAGLAGIGVALAAGPLGCFVVWRRMAYFSDATAHASILGVAMALAFDVPIFAGALLIALGAAFAVSALSDRGASSDTILGVVAHSALAFGLVAVSLLPTVRIDLMGYLFGDILAVTRTDVALVWGGAVLVLALLAWRWSALLLATLSPDLARASGVSPDREQLVLTVTLAIVVACGIKVVGALLVGALLLIPVSTMRPFCRTPERLGALAAGLGGLGSAVGLWSSYVLDVPAGPSIVCVLSLGFLASRVVVLVRP